MRRKKNVLNHTSAKLATIFAAVEWQDNLCGLGTVVFAAKINCTITHLLQKFATSAVISGDFANAVVETSNNVNVSKNGLSLLKSKLKLLGRNLNDPETRLQGGGKMSDYNDANAMKVRRLNRILGELFDAADAVVLTCRAILYVGSVAMAWFYLHDKV